MPKKNANGEGSVFRRGLDGRWVCEIVTGWGPDGRKRVLRHSAKTKREVTEWRTARLAERQTGTLAEPTRQTVGSFLERWLEDSVKTGVAPRTFETYRHVCRKHIIPAIGSVLLTKLAPQHLQRLYRQKVDEGHTRTALMVHAILHRALGQAVRWRIVPRNVADAVDPPRHRYQEMRPLTPEEATRFLDAAREDRLFALYVLAVATGLRQGELLGLKWSDVDFERGTLQVRRTLAWIDGSFRFLEPKTQKSRRTLALPTVAAAALKKHRAAQASERLVLGEAWAEPELVFTTKIGTPLGKSDFIRRSFKTILRRAELPDIRFHDLRHTAATLLLAAGENMRTIQEMLGHSRFGTTADIYAHVLPEQKRRAAESMDLLLASSEARSRSEYASSQGEP